MSDYDKQGGGKGKIKWHLDGSVSIKREGDPWEVIGPADIEPVQEVENKEATMKYQIYLPMAKEIVDAIRLYNLENQAGKVHMEHYVARILAEAVETSPDPKSGTRCTRCGRWIDSHKETAAWDSKTRQWYHHDCSLALWNERRTREEAKQEPESSATGEADPAAVKTPEERGVSRDSTQADPGGLPPHHGPDCSPGGDDLPGTGSPAPDGGTGDGGDGGVAEADPIRNEAIKHVQEWCPSIFKKKGPLQCMDVVDLVEFVLWRKAEEHKIAGTKKYHNLSIAPDGQRSIKIYEGLLFDKKVLDGLLEGYRAKWRETSKWAPPETEEKQAHPPDRGIRTKLEKQNAGMLAIYEKAFENNWVVQDTIDEIRAYDVDVVKRDREEREEDRGPGSVWTKGYLRGVEEAMEKQKIIQREKPPDPLSADLARLAEKIPNGRIEWHPGTGIVVLCPGKDGAKHYWAGLDCCGTGIGFTNFEAAVAAALQDIDSLTERKNP